jgi:hypothetical protein
MQQSRAAFSHCLNLVSQVSKIRRQYGRCYLNQKKSSLVFKKCVQKIWCFKNDVPKRYPNSSMQGRMALRLKADSKCLNPLVLMFRFGA